MSPARGPEFRGPRESIDQILGMRKFTFLFMVDVRFELTTSSSSPFVVAMCEVTLGVTPVSLRRFTY